MFSFESSFIGEQVNASIQALPNDVVRHAYVHTVFNYQANQDKVFIYPSMGVPAFATEFATGTESFADLTNPAGAAHCSPDEEDQDANTKCANNQNFNKGKSLAVNDPKFRFPYWVAAGDTTASGDATNPDARALAYTNCAANNLCLFITIPDPKGSKEMTVDYKYKPLTRTNKAGETFTPEGYETSYAPEINGHSMMAPANPADVGVWPTDQRLVTVEEVGKHRKWHKLIDGTPIIDFLADDSNGPRPSELHRCSRRGLCDFETGKCKCFDGYSGFKCQEKSVLGY